MTLRDRYADAVRSLPEGKRLPGVAYLHVSALAGHPDLTKLLGDIEAQFDIGSQHNIVKFRLDQPRLSFLSYPTFETEAHPALCHVAAVDLLSNRKHSVSYADHPNPPILHRKELMLDCADKRRGEWAELTAAEEACGLLSDTTIIGFRSNWNILLAKAGVVVVAHQLQPSINSSASCDPEIIVARHRTALTRRSLSRPVRAAVESALIDTTVSFFDYGCGKGDDVVGLQNLGIQASGWDPAYDATAPQIEADVVNLGYVLNVIEDPIERCRTVRAAWALTRKVLIVAVITGDATRSEATALGDGILTSRNTFQKFFLQPELETYLEETLQRPAISLFLGCMVVFRADEDHRNFQDRRTRRRTSVLGPEACTQPIAHRPRSALRKQTTISSEHTALLERFGLAALRLGRPPQPNEFSESEAVVAAFGTVKRALQRFCKAPGNAEAFLYAGEAKRNDTLLYLAALSLRANLRSQCRAGWLDTDVTYFFGSYGAGLREGVRLISLCTKDELVAGAWSECRTGWQDEDGLYILPHAVCTLPLILRAVVVCAELLFGNCDQAQLLKLHKRSRKVTFFEYRGGPNCVMPQLTTRHKVDLKRGRLESFDHHSDQQLLYFSHRFSISKDDAAATHPEIYDQLLQLGVTPDRFNGPSRAELLERAIDAGFCELVNIVLKEAQQ